MITGMAHVCISARDIAKAEEFYCSVLGLEKQFSFIRGGRARGFYLALPDGTFIEVFERADAAASEKSLMKHICLRVDDIDAFIATVRGCGVEVSEKELGGDRSWQAWLEDPSGVAIEIHQYTPASCQITKADCVDE